MSEIKDDFLGGIAKSNVDDSLRQVPEPLKPEVTARMKEMKKIDNKNERKAAFMKFATDFAGKISDTGIAAMKKAVLPLAMLCLIAGTTLAATTSDGFNTDMPGIIVETVYVEKESSPMIDFKKIIKNTRTGFFLNQHMDRFIGVYTSVQRFTFNDAEKTEDKTAIGNINLGYLKREDIGDSDSPMFSVSGRLDNLIYKTWQGDWGKAHVSTANLPTIEFGPYVSGWLETVDGKLRFDVFYGVGLAIGF